jgi:hypothetical protein
LAFPHLHGHIDLPFGGTGLQMLDVTTTTFIDFATPIITYLIYLYTGLPRLQLLAILYVVLRSISGLSSSYSLGTILVAGIIGNILDMGNQAGSIQREES